MPKKSLARYRGSRKVRMGQRHDVPGPMANGLIVSVLDGRLRFVGERDSKESTG